MFKNLQVFRLQQPLPLSLAQLEEQLGRSLFRPCASNEPRARGWMPPRSNPNTPPEPGAFPLVHSVNGQWLIMLVTETKILPAAVVNREVEARIATITEAQGYAPGRKQRRELKDRVTEELMPKALSRLSSMRAWIDPVNGWLAVDASSRSRADDMLEQLRISLDTFPIRPLATQLSPTSAMADWLASGTAPDGFTVDRECELKSPSEEKATVRYMRHALTDDNVHAQLREHLAGGKLPTRLAMTWSDRLSFLLSETLEIKRLTLLDVLVEKRDASQEGMEMFDADFMLATGELQRMLPDVLAALGGEVVEAT